MTKRGVTVTSIPHGWTIETYAVHNEALRMAAADLAEERDRRYAEVATEREKALQIKDRADDRALELASQIQAYKDEKANQLREQINSERGSYVTHIELKPIADYITSQQGRAQGNTETRSRSQWTFQQALTLLGMALIGIYFVLNYTRTPGG